MSTLDGKAAVVTGGSRGIGLAIAGELVGRGARVVIAGTDEGRAAAAARTLGSAVIGVRADVRDFADAERLMASAVSHFGGLDILVNNAGIGAFGAVADMPLETWSRVLDTNLTGVFHCCKAALPHLRRRGGGWIVNISSLAGKNPFPEGAAYCASKAALNAFSESLMQEVRQDGVRVAYVLPGSVRTEFSGRTPTEADQWKLAPEDVAQVVGDLVAHNARSLPSRVEIRPSKPPSKG
jgi:NAD(P)-dependent dehydrogenase (short-subunit alcohol dehydrogenase family)